MAIPELYHYGREGYWYNTTKFTIYLLDAVYQVCRVHSVYLSLANLAQ